MATLTRKRKEIPLETKYEIIQCAEMKNEQKRHVAARFDILPNTLNTILKNKCNVSADVSKKLDLACHLRLVMPKCRKTVIQMMKMMMISP